MPDHDTLWLLLSGVMTSGQIVQPDPGLTGRRQLSDLGRLGDRRPVPGRERRRRDAVQHHGEQDRPCGGLATGAMRISVRLTIAYMMG